MQALYLNTNPFTGTVCFHHLPSSLVGLSVAENEVIGAVYLTRLPNAMTYLWLQKNIIEGTTDFSHLPEALEKFDVSYTNLSGEIAVENRTKFYKVEHSNVKLIQ